MKVEITKERILEAASKCSTAKATLMTLFPEVFENEKTYSIGDWFQNKGTMGGKYILVRVDDNKVVLSSVSDGNPWSNIVEVSNRYKINQQEFDTICSSGKGKFIKCAKPF